MLNLSSFCIITEKTQKDEVLTVAIKIAFAIQKGGVGKTSSTVITAELLAELGYRVLVLDLDSQGNASQMITGKNIYEFSGKTILEAMKEMDPREYIIERDEHLHVIPAEDMLATFSRYIYTNNIAGKMRVLANTMKQVEDRYDYILMDCPPNMGDMTLNAIVYADFIIIPTQLGGFCIDALDRFYDFIKGAREEGHTDAEILGIAYTIKESRSSTEQAIANTIRQKFKDLVFKTEIRKRARLKDFALIGTRMERKSDMDALDDYINLTKEVIERCQEKRSMTD